MDASETHRVTPTPVDPAASSGPVDRVAECEALRAEVERLSVDLKRWRSEALRHSENYESQFYARVAAEGRLEAVQALCDDYEAGRPGTPPHIERDWGRCAIWAMQHIRAALAVSPPEPEADEVPTPLSAEIREIAEMWLYDGDSDQPINDGYFRALDLANRLESPKGAS